MLKHGITIGLTLAALTLAAPAGAQVEPEIQLGARGVFSFNNDIANGSSQVTDFSDTSVLFGLRQKLYSRFRSQLVIGFQFPDSDSDLGQIFFHQVFIKIEDKTNIFKLGRSRVRSAMIEFPTLRDDDALPFTDVLNPFSSGENTEDSQYGNVLEYAHVFKQRYWLRVHGEHFTTTPVPPATSEQNFDINAAGLSFQYRVPRSQRWNRAHLDQLGIGINTFRTGKPGFFGDLDETLENVSISTVLNLKPDPINFLDLRHQSILNRGIDGITQLTDYGDVTRAASIANFTSLRYLKRKLERPAYQIAASFGYKRYTDLQASTRQKQYVLNGFYRLGSNFDIGLQLQRLEYSGDLANVFGDDETRIQFALVYSLDRAWNRQFDDRDSLLSLEHGYIP